ncbi:MAG TPA: aminotransferase class III-fold pyridoxal phosphate-dependent enzyme, partial [Candidatus Humimicrobiaceae bacterium]|nr:aminotransferase class III-fold pyridoxal phosphate-dependent enzyme [Candidatus Humimicrobiaceae bacterium]
ASCAAGLAVLDYLVDNRLAERSKKLGQYFMKKLIQLKKKYPIIKDIRGTGLMIGMEFNKPVAEKMVLDALKDKLVLNKISNSTLRFLPALVITKKNINTLIKWLDLKIKEL